MQKVFSNNINLLSLEFGLLVPNLDHLHSHPHMDLHDPCNNLLHNKHIHDSCQGVGLMWIFQLQEGLKIIEK